MCGEAVDLVSNESLARNLSGLMLLPEEPAHCADSAKVGEKRCSNVHFSVLHEGAMWVQVGRSRDYELSGWLGSHLTLISLDGRVSPWSSARSVPGDRQRAGPMATSSASNSSATAEGYGNSLDFDWNDLRVVGRVVEQIIILY